MITGLIKEPLSDNSIIATIQTKTLRIISLLLKKDKEFYKKVITPELTESILNLALSKTKSTLNRSMVTIEFLIEEMRRSANQNEGKLSISGSPRGKYARWDCVIEGESASGVNQ